MTRAGLVSVVMPAYNAERYIGEAIESVLAQTYRPLELIVVDDGSTDGTRAAVERHSGVGRSLAQPNAGIGPARNAGVAVAKGELLAFLDADDLWPPDKLERQVAALRAEPRLDMVFGHAQQFPTPERAEEIERTVSYVREPAPAYLAGAMLIRRAAFERAGPFPSHLELGEFVEWYLRAIDLGLTSAMHERVVLRRRLHDANQGVRMRGSKDDYVRIVRAALARRRGAGREP
jgi:glycosyltransferase involved in cell wall biosynthesis